MTEPKNKPKYQCPECKLLYSLGGFVQHFRKCPHGCSSNKIARCIFGVCEDYNHDEDEHSRFYCPLCSPFGIRRCRNCYNRRITDGEAPWAV